MIKFFQIKQNCTWLIAFSTKIQTYNIFQGDPNFEGGMAGKFMDNGK